jgi:hypothetical protein
MKPKRKPIAEGEHRLNIRLSSPEWDKIDRLARNSTCRTVSEYARKVLAQQPVRIFYRNKSFDDFEEQMTGRLLPVLETFNKKFQSLLPADPALFEAHQQFTSTVREIRTWLAKLSDQCDQK